MHKRYIAYLKDNPQGYWFKRRLYGWGWVPVTWQGWLVIVVFIALLLMNGLALETNGEPSNEDLFWFFFNLILTVTILLLICFKTGETPGWQWGIPKDQPKS